MHDVIYVMWLCTKKPDFCKSSQITNLKIRSGPKIWPPGISRGKNFGGGFVSSLNKSGPGEHKFEPKINLDQATDHLWALFVRNCSPRLQKCGSACRNEAQLGAWTPSRTTPGRQKKHCGSPACHQRCTVTFH
jgi:hypothetical protein